MRIPWRALALCALALVAHAATAQTVEYVHTDLLGSPVAMTDANGQVISRTEYAPYGEQVNRPLEDGPGFTGHVADVTNGLIYMQQRYYDPSIGRFLSVDPVTADPKSGGNFNRYWYANNNPYTNRDPDGRICVVAFGATTEMCARSLRYEALDSDGDIRSKTRFFGAASVVTNALAPTLGSPFLTKLSRDLEAANLGRLQGIRSGAIATSRSTRENDYAFVRFEQSAVQSRLDQLRSDSPALYSSFVGTVNGLLNGMGPRGGDPNFAKAINLAKKEVGGSLDFGNQDHREALGRAMTDVVRSSRNFCTGSRIRTC